MPRLQAGKLRRRLEIQSATDSVDGLGGNERLWKTDNTRWGSVRQLTAGERVAHDQQEAKSVVQITLRHYEGLTTANRIKWGSRIFNIRSVNQEWEMDHVTSVIAVEEV